LAADIFLLQYSDTSAFGRSNLEVADFVLPLREEHRLRVFENRVLRRLFGPKRYGRGSSVGIALGYGLDDRGSRVRFPAGVGIFLFTSASRTALGPTQPPIQWVPGALFLGVKRQGREADHSPPSSVDVKE
jgi:hypothetical protein